MTNSLSAKIARLCGRLLMVLIAALCFLIHNLLDWYMGLRSLHWQVGMAIMIGFYLCVPPVLCALWCMEKLLGNILQNRVFIPNNVRYIRRIRWCCAGVSVVCLGSGILYQPLLFLAVIMAFLALVVSVVKNVMAAAVEIREENDLTI